MPFTPEVVEPIVVTDPVEVPVVDTLPVVVDEVHEQSFKFI